MILLALVVFIIAILVLKKGDLGIEQFGGAHGYQLWRRRHPHKLDLSHPYRGVSRGKYRPGYHHPYHQFWMYRATSPELAHYVDLNSPPYTLANWYSWDSLRRQGVQGTPWWAHYYHYYD